MLRSWRTWAVLLLAVLTMTLSVVVVMQALMLRSRGWGVPIGSLAEWVAAVGGLATVGALVVAWRVYRHDIHSRREDRERQERNRQQIQADFAFVEHYGPKGNRAKPGIWFRMRSSASVREEKSVSPGSIDRHARPRSDRESKSPCFFPPGDAETGTTVRSRAEPSLRRTEPARPSQADAEDETISRFASTFIGELSLTAS